MGREEGKPGCAARLHAGSAQQAQCQGRINPLPSTRQRCAAATCIAPHCSAAAQHRHSAAHTTTRPAQTLTQEEGRLAHRLAAVHHGRAVAGGIVQQCDSEVNRDVVGGGDLHAAAPVLRPSGALFGISSGRRRALGPQETAAGEAASGGAQPAQLAGAGAAGQELAWQNPTNPSAERSSVSKGCICWIISPSICSTAHLVGAGSAGEQLARAHPRVLGIAPHQLLNAAPAHALHKAALHLQRSWEASSRSTEGHCLLSQCLMHGPAHALHKPPFTCRGGAAVRC